MNADRLAPERPAEVSGGREASVTLRLAAGSVNQVSGESKQPHPRYSVAEYVAFEERRAGKYEYWRGQVYAAAGASPAHNQICFNLASVIGPQLQGGDCRGYSSDQKIWVEAAELSAHADLTIVCGGALYHPAHRTLLNPRVIIEVLSPSTEGYDRGEKWACHQQLDSLTDYLLVAQSRAQIEHYARTGGARPWQYSIAAGLGGEVTIASLNCRLPLAAIYGGVELPPPQPPRPPIQIVAE
jgi:Uma2 family endonuclease